MKTAVLYIILAWPGTATFKQSYAFPTMDECLKVLAITRIEIPSHAAENEWIGFATCKYGSPEQANE